MNKASPGALIVMGLAACNSPGARLTLVYSRWPSKTEVDDCAALIDTPLILGAFVETPLLPNHSGRNRAVFVPDLSTFE